jgi:hypothetical protein
VLSSGVVRDPWVRRNLQHFRLLETTIMMESTDLSTFFVQISRRLYKFFSTCYGRRGSTGAESWSECSEHIKAKKVQGLQVHNVHTPFSVQWSRKVVYTILGFITISKLRIKIIFSGINRARRTLRLAILPSLQRCPLSQLSPPQSPQQEQSLQ